MIEEHDPTSLKMSTLNSREDILMSYLSQANNRKQLEIDWYEVSLCYEDSDGDLN